MTIEKTWNALGMQATGTRTINYDGFHIPESGYLGEWRVGAFASSEWASLNFAASTWACSTASWRRRVPCCRRKGATFGASAAKDTAVASIGHIVDGVGDPAIRNGISRRRLWETCDILLDGRDHRALPGRSHG